MSYQVKIPVFEGPLDLLLHLIEKNQVDIYNIPVAEITQQYLDYLTQAGEMDLELTSDFLLMASTLLAIKAKMLLPKPVMDKGEEEEADPREELVVKLLEYKSFKEKALLLRELEERTSRMFCRQIDEVALLQDFPPANPIGQVTLSDLQKAFFQVLRRMEKRRQVVSISRDEVTVQEKITYILYLLTKNSGISFSSLFTANSSTEEIITTFLALLELVRQGRVHLRQKKAFSEIMVLAAPEKGGDEGAHVVS